MDAFAVAISTGIVLPSLTIRHYFRLSFHFGLFQALMPLLGWLAGRSIVELTTTWGHWLAFLLLLYVGSKMIYQSFTERRKENQSDPTRGIQLVMLSVATSMDALVMGFSIALLGVRIVTPAIVIGIVTTVMTFTGMRLGDKLGLVCGQWIEKTGGVLIIGIGLKILIENL